MKLAAIGCAAAISVTGATASSSQIRGAALDTRSSFLEIHDANPAVFHKRNSTIFNSNILTRYLNRRQTTGRCGEEGGGARCPNNQCCSSYGWCGVEFEYCGELVGCQPQFGRCGDAPIVTPTPTSSSSSSTSISSTSSSRPIVPPPSSTSSAPLPIGTIISSNGQCGNSTICTGSGFGNCCSEFYYCGNSDAYCGAGCRSAFGSCSGVQPPISSSSSSRPPVSSPTSSSTTTSSTRSSSSSSSSSTSSTARPVPTNVSTDGRCGANGRTCTGSNFGRCCSDYGWCGNEIDYCGVAYGCQAQWGACGV